MRVHFLNADGRLLLGIGDVRHVETTGAGPTPEWRIEVETPLTVEQAERLSACDALDIEIGSAGDTFLISGDVLAELRIVV